MSIPRQPGVLLGLWLLLLSLVLFFFMGRDKHLARTHRRRIPEAELFLFAVLGGAVGGVLGMRVFRHKTLHKSFALGFPALALLQLGAVLWLWLRSAGMA